LKEKTCPALPDQSKSNRVVWTNTDITYHTLTGECYVDVINSKFDSREHLAKLIAPGETFEFTFTKIGTYPYYCTPNPHICSARSPTTFPDHVEPCSRFLFQQFKGNSR
jgi:hypothetical protein